MIAKIEDYQKGSGGGCEREIRKRRRRRGLECVSAIVGSWRKGIYRRAPQGLECVYLLFHLPHSGTGLAFG